MNNENENNDFNNVEMNWGNGTKVKVKQKRYQVSEKQLLKIMESKLEEIMKGELKFNTIEQQRAFIKPGNIITFKKPLPDFPRGQIAIDRVRKDKSGAIKLINMFGTETPWFKTEDELLTAIDWDWMANNIITKEYEQ